MTISTKLNEKPEGVDNLQAWEYGVMLTIEENSIWKSSSHNLLLGIAL